jgi:hypothetical protein
MRRQELADDDALKEDGIRVLLHSASSPEVPNRVGIITRVRFPPVRCSFDEGGLPGQSVNNGLPNSAAIVDWAGDWQAQHENGTIRALA